MVLFQSSILLVLTFMVSTISSDLSKRVRHYETLSTSQLSHRIVKRGTDPEGTHKYNKIREVGFRTLGRDFRLILSPKKGLLHPNFKVRLFDFDSCLVFWISYWFQAVEIEEVDNNTRSQEFIIPIDHESFYEGRVFGEIKSLASVHLEDGLLTAKIETPEETYHIEPSWRHLAEPKTSQVMIAYKESDVIEKDDAEQHLPHLPRTCGYVFSFFFLISKLEKWFKVAREMM